MRQILDGIRILDAGTVLAAPGASALLGDFGAEVIKVEEPGVGDPVRSYAPREDGQGLINKVTNRGKRSVTIDLRSERGREVFLDLVRQVDVVIMNFRVPTVKKWRIDYDDLVAVNSDLIVLHLTGYGRTGPYADRAGFARASEAFVGLTSTTGYPDRTPVPSGYAIADAIGGIFGAFAVVMALLDRRSSGEGQLIDLSLYEALAKCLDGMYIGAVEGHGIPQRSGTNHPDIAPHDIYPMGDGVLVSLPVSTQNMFRRLCELVGRPDLATDPRFVDNASRVAHRQELDEILRPLLREFDADDFLKRADAVGIAAARINDPLEYARDPHVRERGSFASVWDANLNRAITMQGVVPLFSRTPGRLTSPGPELGQSTAEVLREYLGLSDGEIETLREQGAV
jgi:crotonobetainyl-CoA:carnitine CoA-transferase CaiB-like acyl-CoA transferase